MRRHRLGRAEADGEVDGYVSYFERYSAWKGGPYLAVDDDVRERFRARGVGKAMMQEVQGLALGRRLNMH
jgi:GNAT superfamily N-acetyltransferase